MPRAGAAPAGIADPMADASPIAAVLSLSRPLPRSWWCAPSVASAPMASYGPMDAAVRCKRIGIEQRKAPLARGFFVRCVMWGSPAVAKATPAERAGMPAGRTVVHRSASAIGTAMPARPAAAGNLDHIFGSRLIRIERRHRHRLRRRDRGQTKPDRQRRYSQYLHERLLVGLQ